MSTLRGAETKERALDAALRIHGAGDEASFTIHAIVAESGVSLGSLYHHFGSMDGLCASLYLRSMLRLLAHLVRTLGSARTAKSGIERVVRGYLEFTRDHPRDARFVHGSAYASFLPLHADRIAREKGEALTPLVAFARRQVALGAIVGLPEPMLEALWIGVPAEVSRRFLAGDSSIDLDEAIVVIPPRVFESLASRSVAGVFRKHTRAAGARSP